MADTSNSETPVKIVGGGPKKVLYTLRTVARIGLLNSGKALKSHNACKACGLGMGGQRGGMTNELGEFPSVCNKSIQAQSTDIQAPIPEQVFEHSLSDFQQLSAHELEHLGRLNTPLYKAAGKDRYRPLDWDEALDIMARRFATTKPERSFFYSSGRSSNEAGFVLQLLARLYGTNNVNNCSYYCHQATGVGLKNVVGTGTATVSLADLGQSDLVFIIGANPASNHPRLMHQLQHCRERGGQVIVINPAKEPGLVRFAVPRSAKSMLSGGTQIASLYLQPRINGDLALFKGLAKALIERQQIDLEFIGAHTKGFDNFKADLKLCDWDELCQASGVARAEIEQLADSYARAERAVFCWGMGITHHLNGVENVEAIANLALLRGMVGKPGAGLLPLRGHSNVQGMGTVGVKPELAEAVYQQLEAQLGVTLPRQPGMDTLACLEAAQRGEIDAALMLGGNLFAATPNAGWAQAAMDRIGFKVYLTTTLNRGHVIGMETSEALVLPVSARDEEAQATTQESMFNYVRLSDGGIKRLNNVRSEVEILCRFGQALLPASPVDFAVFRQHRQIRSAIAASIPGMSALANIDSSKEEFTVADRLVTQAGFHTTDGKANFQITPLPDEALEAQEYPFILASVRSEGQFNSIIYEEGDSYRGTENRWTLLMNQSDIADLRLAPDDKVSLRSAHGEMKDLQVQAFDLPKGNILAYYPEANALIGLARDPRSQTPAFKSVAVALKKS